jgi:hypothetical protein
MISFSIFKFFSLQHLLYFSSTFFVFSIPSLSFYFFISAHKIIKVIIDVDVVLTKNFFSVNFTQPYEVGSFIIFILEMREIRYK